MEDLEPVFKKNKKTINDGDRLLKADEFTNGKGPVYRPPPGLVESLKVRLFDKTPEVSLR